MFKYTRAAVNHIVVDVKRLAHVANIVMQSIMILYLGFSLVTERGMPLINGILIGLTAANLLFYLVTYSPAERGVKKLRRRVSRIYIWSKLLINIVPLASICYSAYVGATDISSLTLILTPVMIILWVMQVVFNLARWYVERSAALFMDGIEMDMQGIRQPLVGVKNRIHDFFDEEHETAEHRDVSGKSRKILEAEADKMAAGREAKREENVAMRENRREYQRQKWARRGRVFGNKVKSWLSSDEEE